MTSPRTAGDVLDRHVTFEIESIDRMYCNLYQPRLQHPKAVAGFIRYHLGFPVASTGVFRTEKRRDAAGVSSPWIVQTTAMVNQWYCYRVDTDFGPFFLIAATSAAVASLTGLRGLALLSRLAGTPHHPSGRP